VLSRPPLQDTFALRAAVRQADAGRLDEPEPILNVRAVQGGGPASAPCFPKQARLPQKIPFTRVLLACPCIVKGRWRAKLRTLKTNNMCVTARWLPCQPRHGCGHDDTFTGLIPKPLEAPVMRAVFDIAPKMGTGLLRVQFLFGGRSGDHAHHIAARTGRLKAAAQRVPSSARARAANPCQET